MACSQSWPRPFARPGHRSRGLVMGSQKWGMRFRKGDETQCQMWIEGLFCRALPLRR
jgi:hypothetical protein